jgi:FkbM family methyltransferase
VEKMPIITCPLDCLASFGEVWGGQYDHPLIDRVLQEDAIYRPQIYDIGANVGAFALWAHERWPKAIINCFEPNITLWEFLCNNSKVGNIFLGNQAITTLQKPFLSSHNNRLRSEVGSNGVVVSSVNPASLCGCDILKLDCEGSEADILENITFIPAYCVLEWHSDDLRIRCENAMRGKMQLVESTVQRPRLGMLKFVRIRK